MTGIDYRFLLSWWISENGWSEAGWNASNNPGNISYDGEGLPPDTGWFIGVTAVLDNKVCVYRDAISGVEAFCKLLNTPKSEKELDVDSKELLQAKTIESKAKLLGQSNWSSGHYDDGGGSGSLIVGVYNSPDFISLFPEPEPKVAVEQEKTDTQKAVQKLVKIHDGQSAVVEPDAETLANYVIHFQSTNGLIKTGKLDNITIYFLCV